MQDGCTKKISLHQSYRGRHILLTGATGFLGKVLLSMMRDRLPEIDCIYVLVRKNSERSAEERFIQQVLASPVFQHNQQVTDRIKVIEGDTTLPHLGMPESLANHLHDTLDLVIHVAGLVDFFPDVHQAFDANVKGALEAAAFTAQCKKAALTHISTCYVAGIRSGQIEENIKLTTAPNGDIFDAEQETVFLTNEINRILIRNHPDSAKKSSENLLIALGRQRAAHWGWVNTYVYTKALAEILLVTRYPDLRMTIVRPSIIESAVYFPFAGWNEGLNTTAPLCHAIGKWYPYCLAREKHTLDLIPVDVVSNGILIVSAALLNNTAAPLYQLATSQCNPCSTDLIAKTCRRWHRTHLRKNAARWTDRYFRALKPIKLISPEHFLSPQKLSRALFNMSSKIHFLKNKLITLALALRQIDKINRIYFPFIYEHAYVFMDEAIRLLVPEEKEFAYCPEKIEWNDYWLNIHMPGLHRWVFPLYQDEHRKPE